MVRIELTDQDMIVRVLGWHVLWSCRRTVTVARSSIRMVHWAHTAGIVRPEGFRCPGTYVPGIIAAGTYRQRGRTEFWDVSNIDHALAFELQNAPFTRLVVEVADGASVLSWFPTRNP